MAGKNVQEFTQDNWQQEVVDSDKPVLVDFWAPWCGPCRMIAPVIDELANENAGAVKVGKLNTDNAQNTAMRYDVTGIPTIMLFKDGEVVERFVGVQPKSRLQDAIDSVKG
jgi:thioredoxin 1